MFEKYFAKIAHNTNRTQSNTPCWLTLAIRTSPHMNETDVVLVFVTGCFFFIIGFPLLTNSRSQSHSRYCTFARRTQYTLAAIETTITSSATVTTGDRLYARACAVCGVRFRCRIEPNERIRERKKKTANKKRQATKHNTSNTIEKLDSCKRTQQAWCAWCVPLRNRYSIWRRNETVECASTC